MKLTTPGFSHCLSKPWTDRFFLVNGKQPHATNCTLHMCTAISTRTKAAMCSPFFFQKPPNDGRWGRESVQPCTACVLRLFPWVKYWPYLGVGSTGFLAEFGVISGQIWYIVTLCNTSAGKFFQHVIASFLFHPAKEPLTNSSFSFIRLLGAPQADSVSVP